MKNTSEFIDTVHINIVNFTKGNSLFNTAKLSAGLNYQQMLEPGLLFGCWEIILPAQDGLPAEKLISWNTKAMT